ncbi:MAG TPA: hypothetical protein DCQ98_09055, partial [Planctomycetaceae bacterium]|nr:hypothetical protein [Planctomycetaceae bacterium]
MSVRCTHWISASASTISSSRSERTSTIAVRRSGERPRSVSAATIANRGIAAAAQSQIGSSNENSSSRMARILAEPRGGKHDEGRCDRGESRDETSRLVMGPRRPR